MNYEGEFGTDWSELDRDEALRRAYALGVAAHVGDAREEEFERVRNSADTAYDRELIALAYEEGQNRAAAARAEGIDDDADVWEAVRPDAGAEGGPTTQPGAAVEPKDETESGEPGPSGASRERTTLPPSVTDNGLPDGSPDRLDLPAFLRR